MKTCVAASASPGQSLQPLNETPMILLNRDAPKITQHSEGQTLYPPDDPMKSVPGLQNIY